MPEILTNALSELLAYPANIWNREILAVSYGRIAIATSLLLVSFAVRGLVASALIQLLLRSVGNKTDIDPALIRNGGEPIKLLPIMTGVYLAMGIVGLSGHMREMMDDVLRSLLALVVFWTLSRLVRVFSFLLAPLGDTLTPTIADWFMKFLQALFILVGIAAVLEIWGIHVAPLLAGLGIFGVAVALGAQDLFRNLIAGMLVLAERRFGQGDWIKIEGVVEGTVEQINFRSTLVRRFDKAPVHIPNSSLSDKALINFSRMTHRRIKWLIGVEYSSSIDQLRRIRDDIENWLMSHEDFVKPPEAPLFVRIERLGESSIDFLIYCFTRTTDWGEWLALREEFALALKSIIVDAGSDFAFPSRSLYLHDFDMPEQASTERSGS